MVFQSYKIFEQAPVKVGNDARKQLREISGDFGNRFSGVFVLTDSNTRKYCLPHFVSFLPLGFEYRLLEMKPGEKNKNIDTCRLIWEQLIEAGADRHSLLICLGGGVVCDLGGFVASVYQRSMPFMLVPTSLLAMADASIGGKTGVDYNGLKNFLGTFSLPIFVLIFPEFLNTLPDDELLSGFAEVIKMELVKPAGPWLEFIDKFNTLHAIRSLANDCRFIEKVALSKLHVVEDDFREAGRRKILNFGHTAGHALETYSLRHDAQPLLHGHAIALGIVIELFLSSEKFGFAESEIHDINRYIFSLYPRYPITPEIKSAVIDLVAHDKKNRSGSLNFSLLFRAGRPEFDVSCSADQLSDAIGKYMNFQF